MRNSLLAGAALAALSVGGAAMASTPGLGQNTLGAPLVITLGPGGTATIAAAAFCAGQPTKCGPYDGVEDTYFEVDNNSGGLVSSINVSSNLTIFGFDGDGIAGYAGSGGGNAQDPTGYGGPLAFFTNINPGKTSGTVNFIGGLASGGTGYFSLEETLTAANFQGGNGGITTGSVPEPATWAMMLTGFFGLGSLLRRRRGALASIA